MASSRSFRLRGAALALLQMFVVSCQPKSGAALKSDAAPEGAQKPAASADSASTDPVMRLNDDWKASNERVRVGVEEKLGLTVLVLGHENYVLKKGVKTPIRLGNPTEYDVLKTFAHVAPNVYLRLSFLVDKELDDEVVAALGETKARLQKAFEDLKRDPRALDAERVRWQSELTDYNTAFLDKVIASRKVTTSELEAYTTGSNPLNMRNAKFLVEKIMAGLVRDIGEVVAGFSDAEKASFVALVGGGRQHRREDLRVQTVAKLMGVEGEGERVVYIENTKTDAELLSLFRAHLSDAMIGKQFFKEPLRMSRELLGEMGKDVLRKSQ